MMMAWQIIACIAFFIQAKNNFIFPVLAGVWFIFSTLIFMIFAKHKVTFRKTFLISEAVLTFLLSEAVYKIIIYDNSPFLAQLSFYGVSGMLLVHKFLYQEIYDICFRFWIILTMVASSKSWAVLRDIVGVCVIFVFVWVPHHERIVALSFVGESLHHLDFFIMSPGLVWLHGGKPYVDVISQYGVGLVAVLTEIAKICGGFDYTQLVGIIMGWGIVYFIITFLFFRRWLNSWLLALAAFFILFRLQMCHYGISPLAWNFPSTTPIRFGFDILWLWLLWQYGRDHRKQWLFLAAIYGGFALFWMTTTGACVVLAFAIYLFLSFVFIPKERLTVVFAGALVLVSGGSLFAMALGSSMFGLHFWQRMIEYIQFFAHGHAGGVMPIYESIKYRHWWAFAMAMIMPFMYVFTLVLAICRMAIDQKWQGQWRWLVVVCVYGLIQYQYFVVRSAVTSYYVASLCLVILCAWWFKYLVTTFAPQYRREIYAGALGMALFALITNHNYTAYPNSINFSRNPLVDPMVAQHFPDRQGYFSHQVKNMKEEDKVAFNNEGERDEYIMTEEDFKSDAQVVEYTRTHMDFSKDALMIQRYIPPEQKVALLSSFETAILISANRGPLFYHTPMISSRPMSMRTYLADAAHSPNFLSDSLAQLTTSKPLYIFMEKIFLQDKRPASYDELPFKNITVIADYIKKKYKPLEEGRFLVVMKRM